MKILLTETWLYKEYSHWLTEALPDGWDDMDTQEKALWVQENCEFYRVDTDPIEQTSLDDVEVV